MRRRSRRRWGRRRKGSRANRGRVRVRSRGGGGGRRRRARERARKGRGEGSACERGSNGREATTSETESVVMPEARARRSFEGETSREAKAKTPRARAETTGADGRPARRKKRRERDRWMNRTRDTRNCSGAKELFANSSSRARSAQADMYIQDYMERNVYGYAATRRQAQDARRARTQARKARGDDGATSRRCWTSGRCVRF